ncbi:hypothetical protein [Pediococcus ethanolidurans]|uniref:Uncharacterized protein n=1 Tax=Pediococcus ethanolidurans TaxID=319653 RepID=A0A0R2JVY0_9LACO|nr:hypothetical protein [Pediococcus ethanolidurans]KRN81249.1 hypothetical protein IV87_GL001463 [Pediococcus ethanolidurans]GEN96018.1 hypothetical protein PET01_20680 [Pediococcus ethanolidurans]SER94305.1 hypothetical protein SAMN04487973_1314 [Pediococcus ethanolidurans]
MAYRVKDTKNNKFIWTYLDLVEVSVSEKDATKFETYEEASDYLEMAKILVKNTDERYSFVIEEI